MRSEISDLRWWRRQLLRAELTVRGLPHTVGSDAVVVYANGRWFDVYAWLRNGRSFTWAIDYPHAELADEHPGHEIGRQTGFRFRVDQLPELWRRYQITP
ncbi:hypothetical protein ACQPXH_24580 [Nocardia sp. CA-135953]|uniref:hypothetical protein n=1 Tax=Nocardia sp. CA-135953 TaxID=3239978 RepID=UPI003D97D404